MARVRTVGRLILLRGTSRAALAATGALAGGGGGTPGGPPNLTIVGATGYRQ